MAASLHRFSDFALRLFSSPLGFFGRAIGRSNPAPNAALPGQTGDRSMAAPQANRSARALRLAKRGVEAACMGDVEALRKLALKEPGFANLRHSLSPDRPGSTGHGFADITPLEGALLMGAEPCVEFLLPLTALAQKGAQNHTPLMAACSALEDEKAERIIPLLLANNDPNDTDRQGRTALAFAVSRANQSATRILAEDPRTRADIPNRDEKDALGLAAAACYPDIIALLIPRASAQSVAMAFCEAWGVVSEFGATKGFAGSARVSSVDSLNLLADHAERALVDRAFSELGPKGPELMPKWAAKLEAEALAGVIQDVEAAATRDATMENAPAPSTKALEPDGAAAAVLRAKRL